MTVTLHIRIRFVSVTTFLFLFFSHAGLADAYLSVKALQLANLIKNALPANALWSFSLSNLDTEGETITIGNVDGGKLIPGSIIKLFTIAAVMDAKEKISMDTLVAVDDINVEDVFSGNLYLKGSGNALLSGRDLQKAVEKIRSMGVKEIIGDIVADDSLLDPKGWESRWDGPAYAPPGSLGLDLHTLAVTASGKRPEVRVDPLNEAVRIIFSPDGGPDIRRIDDFTYEVSGAISDTTVVRKRFSLKDPAVYAAWTLKTLLEEKGVNHRGRIRRGKMPVEVITVCTIKSKNLSDIVQVVNKNSLNVFSENLLLLLGEKRFGPPGTFEKGINAVKEFLTNIGLSIEEIDVADGSGLSPKNSVTSGYIVGFLKKISEKPWFDTFYESLPRVGIDGTMKRFSYTNPDIRAKTGRLDNAYSLAGYIDKKTGGRWAFSYMVNVSGAAAMGIINAAGIELLKNISEDKNFEG